MRIILLLMLQAIWVITAEAQPRKAFVVGVGEYEELTNLSKTVGDANGYADVFENDLGFEVTRLINPTTEQFLASLDKFVSTINPGDQVSFVFSGHGWSDGSQNYLALKDAPHQSSEFILKRLTVSLSSDVMDELIARKPQLVFAVIDACRDNPFDLGTKSVSKGLVPQQNLPNTLIVYAAGDRQKALDRLTPEDRSPYSVFTRNLLPKLKNPSVPLLRILDEARSETSNLAEAVMHAQRPAIYSDISLDFCFGTCASGGRQTPKPKQPSPAFLMWKSISGSTRASDFEQLAKSYPRTPYSRIALERADYLNSVQKSISATEPPPPPPACAIGPYLLFFGWNDYSLTPEARSIVDNAYSQMFGGVCMLDGYVALWGHSDRSINGRSYDAEIGFLRANAVKGYLISMGVPEELIVVESFGSEIPRVPTADGVRELQNRRVEIVTIPFE